VGTLGTTEGGEISDSGEDLLTGKKEKDDARRKGEGVIKGLSEETMDGA